jgi:hypothetical protein
LQSSHMSANPTWSAPQSEQDNSTAEPCQSTMNARGKGLIHISIERDFVRLIFTSHQLIK